MWCRVLLFVIALTCTFQREINADIDDVLCVVILSGLQKDDLDVNLLEKLRRRNVNIDDINNRKTIEKCTQRSGSERSNESKEIAPTLSEQTEQTIPQESYNITETIHVEDLSSEKESLKSVSSPGTENIGKVESPKTPSYENIIKLWISLNKTAREDNEFKIKKETENGMTIKLPLSFEKETKTTSDTKDLSYIHKIFGSAEVTTTVKLTTTRNQLPNKIKMGLRQMIKIQNNNNNNHDTTIVSHDSDETDSELTSEVNYNNNETLELNDNFKNKTKLIAHAIENSISRATLHNLSLENFLNLWIRLNKTNYHEIQYKTTEKSTTIHLPDNVSKETKITSKATDLDLIHKLIISYLSKEKTSRTFTSKEIIEKKSQEFNKHLKRNKILSNYFNQQTQIIKPTITEKQTDSISQKNKEFSENNKITGNYIFQKAETTIKPTEEKTEIDIVSHIKDFLKNNNIEREYYSQQENTTAKSPFTVTTTGKEIDILSQTIKEFLKNNNILEIYTTKQAKASTEPIIPEKQITDFLKNNKTFDSYKQTNINIKSTTTEKTIDTISQQIKEFLKNNKLLVNYIPQQLEATMEPTTTEIPVGVISQIKELLKNYKINHAREANKTIKISTTEKQVDTVSQQIQEFLKNNKVLKNYFPLHVETTVNPTPTERQTDIVSKKIEEFLNNNSMPGVFFPHTETTVKPAAKNQTEIVSEMIQNFLKHNNFNYDITSDHNGNEDINKKLSADTNHSKDENLLTRKSDLLSSKLLPTKHQLNIPGYLVPNFEDVKKSESDTRIVKTRSNKNEQTNIAFNNRSKIDPQSKYIEILKAYIAAKSTPTSTQQPTTTPEEIEILLQEIRNFFENNGNNYTNYHIGTPEFSKNIDGRVPERNASIANNNLVKHVSLIAKAGYKDEKPYNLQVFQASDMEMQQMPIMFNNDSISDYHSKELDHIFHMFEAYMATKDDEETISVQTTTPKHIDVIAQRVKEYLESSNNNKYRRVIPPQIQRVKVARVYDSKGKLLHTRKIDYMKHLQNQAIKLKRGESLNNSTNNDQQGNTSNIGSETTKNINVKPLPVYIMKDIAEKVKASVLKDLQKHLSTTTLQPVTNKITTEVISTTVIVDSIDDSTTGIDNVTIFQQRFKKESGMENTTEITPTTGIPSQIDKNKIKTATMALENFLELFEQFKDVKDSIMNSNGLKHKLTQKGKTKNEFHGPINVVYPSLLPLHYAYNVNTTQPVSSLPIFIHPYGININNPMLQKTKITNAIRKVQYPFNDMEDNLPHPIQAEIIQTDDVQVPLLPIPVPKSVGAINQNIIVTTKHPNLYGENREHRSDKAQFHDYTARGGTKYNPELDRVSDIDYKRYFDSDLDRHSDSDMPRYHSDVERVYDRNNRHARGRYSLPGFKHRTHRDRLSPRSKQAIAANDNFHQQYFQNKRDNDEKLWEAPENSQEHKRERFHERLERPDITQHRLKLKEPAKKEKPVSVASRQQMSIVDLKKKKNNSNVESHYENFLQSQKKVNDMLERLLKSENVRSVEAI